MGALCQPLSLLEEGIHPKGGIPVCAGSLKNGTVKTAVVLVLGQIESKQIFQGGFLLSRFRAINSLYSFFGGLSIPKSSRANCEISCNLPFSVVE
jgi:hypothetical protein